MNDRGYAYWALLLLIGIAVHALRHPDLTSA